MSDRAQCRRPKTWRGSLPTIFLQCKYAYYALLTSETCFFPRQLRTSQTNKAPFHKLVITPIMHFFSKQSVISYIANTPNAPYSNKQAPFYIMRQTKCLTTQTQQQRVYALLKEIRCNFVQYFYASYTVFKRTRRHFIQCVHTNYALLRQGPIKEDRKQNQNKTE